MYQVSEAFFTAVQENTRSFYWAGKITTKAGAVYEFGNEDIVKGSGYITSQCCGSTEIEIGTVYAAEMGITLLSEVDRYTLEGGKIELFYHLVLSDGTEDMVPMGIFEISEANRTIRCLEIKAYDYMLRLEKSFNGFETVGNAYAFLALCCKACDVELAHTQAEIEAMPNGSEMLSVYAENDIETYRDVLLYVGQVLGGFFCINREGRLELRKYGNQSVVTVSDRQRFSSSFSDFITRYTAVSSTNIRKQISEYYALEPDDGLSMNLGVNPLLQFGLEETRKTLLENILADLAMIKYVPFDSDTIGNPALDLGDVLVFSGGHADETQMACVTGSQLKINGKHSLKCVGKNPRLAQAKSKNDKNISGLMNQIETGKIGLFTYTNAKSYSLSNVKSAVISMEFAASVETDAQFIGQVMLDVSAGRVDREASASGRIKIPIPVLYATGESEDTNVAEELEVEVSLPVKWQEDGKTVIHISYEFDDNVVALLHPEETYGSGRHILSLYYPLSGVTKEKMHSFKVYLWTDSGTASITEGGCIASISGQAMAAAVKNWDGTLNFEEMVPAFVMGQLLCLRPQKEQLSITNPSGRAVICGEPFAGVTTGFADMKVTE